MIRSWMTQVDFNSLLLPLPTPPPPEPSIPLAVGRRPGQCSRRNKLSATPQATKRSPDDYHATIKALNSKGRRPTKSLGQHYMLNSDVNERLAAAADVGEGDVVLEIGPGTGSLTHVLIGNGATVLAVEKDRHMAAIVTERFASTSRLKVVQEDFVKCRIASLIHELMQSTPSGNGETRLAKVVANVPFNITKDIIRYLLPMGDIFSEVALLLQEETALRITKASPCTSEYRPINVFVNFYSEPNYEFHVPRSNFFPQPNVDAAVVTFKLKKAAEYPDVMSTKRFFSMVNSAFSGRRKMLRKSLQHISTALEIEEALDNVGLPATSRPEELTVDDFVNFYNKLVVQPMSSSSVDP